MANKLLLTRQNLILIDWSDEIERCVERLEAAAGNATRAVSKWTEFASTASQADLTETGQAVAMDLLAKEQTSLNHLATLCKTFAAATGQTNEQIISKLTTAINA